MENKLKWFIYTVYTKLYDGRLAETSIRTHRNSNENLVIAKQRALKQLPIGYKEEDIILKTLDF